MDGVVVVLIYLAIAMVFAGGNVYGNLFGSAALGHGTSALLNAVSIFLLAPMGAALAMAFLDFVRGENLEFAAVMEHFKNHYTRVLLAGIVISLLVSLGIFSFGILSIYFSLCYSMTFYLMRDYPELTWYEAMKTSREMIYGHKLDYLWLQLSFIGWIIVCFCTMGLGFLWLEPYMQTAKAHFYEDLKAETIVEENEDIQEAEVVE